MTITYQVGDSLYLNITNRCNCNCTFCIRREHNGVGDGNNLWLEHEPTLEEIIADLEGRKLTEYNEIVFCGYGEPTERLDILLDICRYLRDHAPALPIRLNTNGLAELLYDDQVASRLHGLVDVVSVSLNAPDKDTYTAVTRPKWGKDAFANMLHFAEQAACYVPRVQFSVVDILPPDEIAQCQQLADTMKIPLRIRTKS